MIDGGEAPLVVVIDDQDDFREVLVAVLEQGGLRVAAYGNGATGLVAAETLKARLVITDLSMPHPDGIEIARRMTRPDGTRPIPVLLVSAHAATLRDPALEQLFDTVLPKPLDPVQLMAIVRRLTGMDPRQGPAIGSPAAT